MGSFTGTAVLNSKLISTAPLEGNSTIGKQQSNKSDKSLIKAIVDIQEEDRKRNQQQIAEVVEREDLDDKSGDSIVTEISDDGQKYKRVDKEEVEVEKLIVTASDAAIFASN